GGETVRQHVLGILPEVERVLAAECLECDYVRGGGLFAAARYPEQLEWQRAQLAALRALGYGEEDYRWLDSAGLAARLAITRPLGAIYTPHVARIQPARLVSGLAAAVTRLGVKIFEQTPVVGSRSETLTTPGGTVTAPVRVLAVEGVSSRFADHRRRVLPVQSRIIATEPLSSGQWQELGLASAEVFADASPVITYGQRSADGRLVFGARGAYRFGGRPRSRFDGDPGAFHQVRRLLLACLPQLQDVAKTHAWGGTLGIPRSGSPHAVLDPVTGFASLGGYTGEGVGAANLMARSLVDLILERDTGLSRMPWCQRLPVRKALRRWEPEPLRWLGFRAISSILGWQEAACAAGAGPWKRRLLGLTGNRQSIPGGPD
ncbi:MAG: FAD-binding oxidoreductase, partial [Haliea sp.]|uniref:NAD(P)/FAD-dependent oxidoreductase n=1 Tax=Haliea sp. TaxID=1932666 RepID=UPI0032EF53D8